MGQFNLWKGIDLRIQAGHSSILIGLKHLGALHLNFYHANVCPRRHDKAAFSITWCRHILRMSADRHVKRALKLTPLNGKCKRARNLH